MVVAGLGFVVPDAGSEWLYFMVLESISSAVIAMT
jgi:hypothetical protein